MQFPVLVPGEHAWNDSRERTMVLARLLVGSHSMAARHECHWSNLSTKVDVQALTGDQLMRSHYSSAKKIEAT